MPHQVTHVVVAAQIRSERACAVKQMLLHYHGQPCGSLEAVDCYIHSVRYDIVLESNVGGHLRCLIRSPTSLLRRLFDQQEFEP
eukprot:scaffold3221_cov126-Skeletonema_marinoi.AAC.15